MMNDVTCTNCHGTRDAATNVQVPAGQLNLTNDTNDYPATFIPNADQVHTYRELLFADNVMGLVAGQLEYVTTPTVPLDPITGLPTNELVPVSPSMSAAGARASYFIEKMTETELDAARTLPAPTVDHTGMLTDAELRLIAEWLAIGAQYYNNPFDPLAPQN